MSLFAVCIRCDIIDVKSGKVIPRRLALSVDARDDDAALRIVEKNLEAAMLHAQQSISETTALFDRHANANAPAPEGG